MKLLNKILSIIFVLIYLTHVYNRLIFTSPIFINVAVNHGPEKIKECDGNKSSSFILARRHLPSIKQFEANKLYPVAVKTKAPDLFEYIKLTYHSESFFSSKKAEFKSHKNKAPPAFS